MRRVNRYSQTTRDANEPELVKLAKQLCAQWWEGPPMDGWRLFRGVWVPVEIKTGERHGWADEYTANQKRFLAFCAQHHAPVETWRYEEDVLKSLGAKRTA